MSHMFGRQRRVIAFERQCKETNCEEESADRHFTLTSFGTFCQLAASFSSTACCLAPDHVA